MEIYDPGKSASILDCVQFNNIIDLRLALHWGYYTLGKAQHTTMLQDSGGCGMYSIIGESIFKSKPEHGNGIG